MKYLQVLLPLVVLTFFVNACTTRYAPVDNVHIDSVRVVQLQRDTVYEKDSTVIYLLGDTVYLTRYRYVYRDRLVRDTIYKSERDTIINVVEVERSLTHLEALKMSIGNGVMWAIPFVVALWLLYCKFIK